MSDDIFATGVAPSLAVTADTAPSVPHGLPKRSEAGVGALMPWADKLYMISYLSVPHFGSGTGLYEIDENLEMTKIANHTVSQPCCEHSMRSASCRVSPIGLHRNVTLT